MGFFYSVVVQIKRPDSEWERFRLPAENRSGRLMAMRMNLGVADTLHRPRRSLCENRLIALGRPIVARRLIEQST